VPHAVVLLPDLLRPGLRLVFCGTAAGTRSARQGAYYAGPGNRFWATLHDVDMTPRRLRPDEFPQLLDHGIGLTDVCKTQHGMDHQIAVGAFDAGRLEDVLLGCAPGVVAFNGKKAARTALGLTDTASLPYGRLGTNFAGQPTWVLPSTSGAGSRYWDREPWQDLADAVAPRT